jgi:hypothetical protein
MAYHAVMIEIKIPKPNWMRLKGGLLFPLRKVSDVVMEGVYAGDAQREHLDSIRESSRHDYLYECLNILDNKAAALLQYDSIILAAATLALAFSPNNSAIGTGLVVASLIISGLSSISCLQVIWVYWTLSEEFNDPSEKFLKLMQVRNIRTVLYRVAWILAQVSVLILIVGVISKVA